MARNPVARMPLSPRGLLTTAAVLALLTSLAAIAGCANRRSVQAAAADDIRGLATHSPTISQPIVLVEHLQPAEPVEVGDDELPAGSVEHPNESLQELELLALSWNPALNRLRQEATAAQAKVSYIDELPDPTIGVNVFAHPIETAAGSQRANLSVAQMIPWLGRLDAQSQRACFEAQAAEQIYEVERLKVVGDVRATWYRLYTLQKQLEANRDHQKLLESLLAVANSRVATGKASQGDVLLGTLEFSKLEGQVLTLNQQVSSTKAELNRLTGRMTEYPLHAPLQIDVSLPPWSHAMLRQVAWEEQPEVGAAQLQAEASKWGIEVARLQRRPNLSLSASWFAIDDNRPTPSIVDVGRDAWAIGAQVSVPLWRHKYDAIEEEAARRHAASHATVDEAMLRYDSLLRDLWEKAKAADETSQLYRETLLPLAQLTMKADQVSYRNGTIDFNRVIQGFRTVVTLNLGYHRAVGELAVVLARIQQAVGTDLLGNRVPVPAPGVLTNQPSTANHVRDTDPASQR